MSVTTTADDKLVKIREDVESAVEQLSDIVINRCWGWEDFSREYQGQLRENLNTLLDLRDEL